jgi:hypothetical protein
MSALVCHLQMRSAGCPLADRKESFPAVLFARRWVPFDVNDLHYVESILRILGAALFAAFSVCAIFYRHSRPSLCASDAGRFFSMLNRRVVMS